MQSEETVAIRQNLQTTDSDNFDVHVEEYIIQEHNDDQISSDGTVEWERNIHQAKLLNYFLGSNKSNINQTTYTISPHYSQPARLTCQ